MTAPFHLDLRAPQQRHSEATKYAVAVFWTAGYSAQTIANMLGLRRSQALNLAQKTGLIDRATASDAQRRELLAELRAIRFDGGPALDGGILDKFDWRIQPLTGRMKRPGRAS